MWSRRSQPLWSSLKKKKIGTAISPEATLGARDFSERFPVCRSWLRPTAEAVSAFGRQVPPHARKTSGTQGISDNAR